MRNILGSSFLLFAIISLAGCDRDGEKEKVERENSRSSSTSESAEIIKLPGLQRVVAEVGKHKITLGELDESIKLPLYETQWRNYELRMAQLELMISDYDDDLQPQEIFLERPLPPRIDLPESRVNTGRSDAPIRLSIFCSFQSPHCMRLQVIIKQLTEEYGELLSFHYFDYPQSFHRFAKNTANAARCAFQFDIYQTFVDALYMDIATLNNHRFESIVGQLNIDKSAFKACLEEDRYLPDVEIDINLAGELGLGNVPILFINGLYTKGVLSFEDYQYFIDYELIRLDVDESHVDSESESSVTQNAMEDPSLEMVNSNANQTPLEATSSTRSLPTTGTMTLSKDWVRQQLAQRDELEKHIQNAEHVVNGAFNLVKLKDVGELPFYETLGLQEGDVLMQVNGEWIHSGQNSLWTALALERPITLVIMRGGFPIRYDYVIDHAEDSF